MKTNSTSIGLAEVRQAIAGLEKAFPFPNYFSAATAHEMLAIIQDIQRFLPPSAGPSPRLLDIGSGPMDKTGVLQTLGFQCHAVDDLQDPWHLRDDNVPKIEAYARQLGIRFHRQEPGNYAIPFEEASFDVVTSLAVIEHLHESPRELLNTMGTFARDGGLLVVQMPNAVNLRKRLSVLFGKTNYPPVDMFYTSIGTWRGHVREYTLQETVYVCEASGFEVLSARAFESLAYDKFSSVVLSIFLLLARLVPTIQSGLLVVCRKPAGWKPRSADPESYRQAIARGVPQGVA